MFDVVNPPQPTPLPDDLDAWLTTSQTVGILGISEKRVKKNAEALGGIRVSQKALGQRRPGWSWMFPPDVAQRSLE